MIMQAGELKDRVALLDIFEGWKGPETSVINDFRGNMGVSFLSYAIAYYPWLECSVVDAAEVTYANLYTNISTGDVTDINIKDILKGVPLIPKLDQITRDMDTLKYKLFVTPSLKLGGSSGTEEVYPSWANAFNGSPQSDVGGILSDQGLVLAAMYQTIVDLGY